MNKKLNPELIDDDNPEWTDEMFKKSVRFDALPESLQAKLRGRPKAVILSPNGTSRLQAQPAISSGPRFLCVR